MGREDWYRNTKWDSATEGRFFDKLARARDKSQYLRIQASYLAESKPNAALKLLEKYFALGGHFAWAQALVDQATAYMALGRVQDAIESLRSALKREKEFPNLKTGAWSEFAMLVATNNLVDCFDEAADVLDGHVSALMFPKDHFKWHAAYALIKAGQRDLGAAKREATKALEAAQATHSGFRHHPDPGLVGQKQEGVRRRLAKLLE